MLNFLQVGFENLPRFEFDNALARNHDVHLGLVRVAPDSRLTDLNLEGSEVPQFDALPSGKRGLHGVQGCLDNVPHDVLLVVSLGENIEDDLAFC